MKIYSEKYKNFLKSEEIYREVSETWRNYIISTLGNSIEDWVINSYQNGKLFLDGNPIFSCKIGDNRAIRIIMSSRDKITPLFASWNSSFISNENNINELVISLQPYQTTFEDTQALIEKYIENSFIIFQRKINQKYNKETNNNRIRLISQLVKKYLVLELPTSKVKAEEKINLKTFKQVNDISEHLMYFESAFKNVNVKKKYNQTIKELDALNRIITIKSNFEFNDRKLSKEKYNEAINQYYSNFYNFSISYNTQIKKLTNKLEELKESVPSE